MSLNFVLINSGRKSVDVDITDDLRGVVINRGTKNPLEETRLAASQNSADKIFVSVKNINNGKVASFEWKGERGRLSYNVD